MKLFDDASLLLSKAFASKTKKAVDTLFASKCAICDRAINIGADICPVCEKHLPFTSYSDFCIGCGKPREYCICKEEFFFFDTVVSPFLYTEGIKDSISRIKFASRIDAIPFFAKHMAQKALEVYGNWPDFITYVPLDEKRKSQRGFDQSRLLALEVSKLTNIPFKDNVLTKVFDTPEQHLCSAIKRKGNLFAAYDVDVNRCVGKTVLLIDDVSTTGATFNECAKMLKIFGALRVLCLCAAAAVINKEEHDSKFD